MLKIKEFLIVPFALLLSLNTQADCKDAESKADQSVVIAVDISHSVDTQEMNLQMQGYQQAFMNENLWGPFLGCGCTEVSVIFWSESQSVVFEPQLIRSEEDLFSLALLFGNQINSPTPLAKLYGTGYVTNVRGALEKSLEVLKRNANQAFRKVVLISGDGPPNEYTAEEFLNLKNLFRYEAIQVHGLPIIVYEDTGRGRADELMEMLGETVEPRDPNDIPEDLYVTRDFYRDHVVTHPNYLTPASSFSDVGRALSQSLEKMVCLMM